MHEAIPSLLWRQFRGPWQRSLWDLVELHAFSFIGKNRKTIALWRFWLHFFKQMHLSLGTGPRPRGSTDPHPEATVVLAQPGLQPGGQYSAVDTWRMCTPVILGLESYVYNSGFWWWRLQIFQWVTFTVTLRRSVIRKWEQQKETALEPPFISSVALRKLLSFSRSHFIICKIISPTQLDCCEDLMR